MISLVLLFQSDADIPGVRPPAAQGDQLRHQVGQPYDQVGAGGAVRGAQGRRRTLQEGRRVLGRGRRRRRPRGQ